MRRIMAVAVAVLAAASVGGCGVKLDAKEVHSAQGFAFSGDVLTIESSLGGLRVLPGTAGSVQVERWVRGKAAEEGNASWSLRDGTLRLSGNCVNVFGDCGARYHVKVPPGVRLVVDGGDDGVILNRLAQDVDVSTSGPIRVYETEGRLRLRGNDEVITGERLRSADVRARTTAGNITLSFAAPPSKVDVSSVDGRVTATVPDGAYGVTAKSTHGSERSQIKDTRSDRTIIARSTSGDVRVNAG
ncbi:DUF4097 family beta strand repeat-containing protein [Streptosporangium sp. NPDC004379]|uniref:DUF4097 family beta strand repeat-containing protein n=1 Tax=Streptosporangium sp. NPDC004379 TaxID=3366189 RepID=UPI0036C1F6E1